LPLVNFHIPTLISNNMYEATKKDNLKLTGLHNQMGEMDADFEEMMRMRNEAKKRLEEKFKDVYQ
jgi:hypothetical protein